MNEKELFNEVLDYFVDYYKLEIRKPTTNDYIEIYKGDNLLGGFNPSGHNLLFCLRELCRILEQELI